MSMLLHCNKFGSLLGKAYFALLVESAYPQVVDKNCFGSTEGWNLLAVLHGVSWH